jgi:hypothetical protein
MISWRYAKVVRNEMSSLLSHLRDILARLLRTEICHYTLAGAVWQATLATICWAGWKLIPAYTLHPIYTGYAIAVLGVMAVVMAARAGHLTKLENAIWISLAVFLFIVEIHIINEDHRVQESQHLADLNSQAYSFATTLDKITKNSETSSKQFKATTKEFSRNEVSNQNRFDKLIDHEEKISEAQTGVLAASNEPTPIIPCGPLPPGAMIAIVEQGGVAGVKGYFIFHSLPHVIVESKSHGPVLSVDRTADGNIS